MSKSKYAHRTLGWFEAIVNKLGGEAAADRFLRSGVFLGELPLREFIPWTQLCYGTDGLTSFVSLGLNIDWGDEFDHRTVKRMLSKIEYPYQPKNLNLALVLVRDLGFTEEATLAEIYEKALVSGLELCPAEVGPMLCSYMEKQGFSHFYKTYGELDIHIGMEPIHEQDIFGIVPDGDARITLADVNADEVETWPSFSLFVFVLPEEKS